jgi:gliding motility-associated-like protein
LSRSKAIFRGIALLAVLFFWVHRAAATHTLGGEILYTYVGDTNNDGLYRYVLTVNIYQDCFSPNWPSTFPRPTIPVGIFKGGQTATSLGPRQNVILNFVDSIRVLPPRYAGCPGVTWNGCVSKVVYRGFVDVSDPISGYWFVYDEFARSGSGTTAANNLLTPANYGTLLYSWTAGPLSGNNSAIFDSLATAFICIGDTVSLADNIARDIDMGQTLNYTFVDVLDGLADVAGAGASNPYIGVYSAWPPLAVPFSGTSTASLPMGAGSYAFVNGLTGQTRFKVNTVGNYAVGMRIKEIDANNNTVGIMQREYLYAAVSCSNSLFINVNGPRYTGNKNFSVQAGDSICATVEFTEPDQDNCQFTKVTSNLFDGSLFANTATLSNPVRVGTKVTAQLCWQTTCKDVNTLGYDVFIQATDTGACLPKPGDGVIKIRVNPPPSPSAIGGNNILCAGQTNQRYSSAVSADTIQWTVTGGTIATGQGTSAINVNWGNGPSGNVRVVSKSRFGCISEPVDFPVLINTFPTNPGLDKTICLGDTATLGGDATNPTAPPKFQIKWTPATGLTSDTAANPKASPAFTTVYTLSVTDTFGLCTVIKTVRVTVGSIPNASAAPDTTICQGDSVQLRGQGGTKYTWRPGNLVTDSTIANPKAFNTTTQQFILLVENSTGGCPTYDTITVRVDTPGMINAGNNRNICMNQTSTLGGSPTGPAGTTFLWAPFTNLSSATAANPIFTPVGAGTFTYTLTATTAAGCVFNKPVNVKVDTVPVVQLTVNPITICFGDTATLTATGANTYTYVPNFGTGSPLKISPADTTQIIVTGRDLNNCSAKDTVVLNVNELPRILIAADSVFLCELDSMDIPTTPGAASYTWTPNYNILPNINAPVPRIYPRIDTLYKVFIQNYNGCDAFDSIYVYVDDTVPTNAGPNRQLCFPGSTVIGGNPTGPLHNPTLYTWFPATGLNNPNLANPTASIASTTTYAVFTQNGRCFGADTMTLTVFQRPVVQLTTDTFDICNAETVQVDTFATSGNIVTWNWTPASGLSATNVPNPRAFPSTTTHYTLSVVDNNGCDTTARLYVNVRAFSPFALPDDTTICLGDSVAVVLPNGQTYTWSPDTGVLNAGTTPFLSPTDTILYVVTGLNPSGCTDTDTILVQVIPAPVMTLLGDTNICRGDTAFLRVSGGDIVRWSPTTFLGDANAYSTYAVPIDTTLYVARITDTLTGCWNRDTASVLVNPPTPVAVTPDTALCKGIQIRLDATGATRYSWTPGTHLSDSTIGNPLISVVDTITYTITGEDNIGCIGTATLTIRPIPIPSANAGGMIIVCNDTVTTLKLGGNPTGPVDALYAWSSPELLNDPALPNPSTTFVLPKTYYLQVTDTTTGCSAFDSAMVRRFSFSVRASSVKCSGDSSQLSIDTIIGTPPFNYLWTPSTGLSSDTARNPKAKTTGNSSYTVFVSDTNNCSDSVKVDILITSAVDASFKHSIAASCDKAMLMLENTSQNAVSYEWIMNGNVISQDIHPEIEIPFNQNFDITLQAFGGDGCTDTSSNTDAVKGFDDYFTGKLPNVFSPNGDNINDLFDVKVGQRLEQCTNVEIYNRWGQLVFKSFGVSHQWDGKTFEGENCPDGVYFYVVEINQTVYKGNVTLLR